MAPVVGDGVRIGDEGCQLDLEWVGVLEFVEQEAPVLVGESGAHGEPVDRIGQDTSGEDQ